MPRELYLAPEAGADLSESFKWYETQRAGLGSELLAEVARTFARIERAPEQFRVVRGRTRRVLVERFPYFVIYVVDADRIVVTGVLHARRDPERWFARADV